MAGCRSAAKHARAYIQELGKLEYGTSAEETRQLLEQHEKKVKEVLEDSRLTNLMNEGKQIIDRIQDDYNELPTTEDYSDTIQCVHSLYNQMNHLFDKLQEYSSKRKRKLQLCLQLRTFDEEGDRLINWLHSEGDPFLDTHADTGDSIGHVRSLQGDFSQFQSIAKENCAKATEMINSGRELLELDYIPDDRDWIRERLDRLEDAFNNFSLKFDERKKTLKQSMHFHTLIEQASNWSLECLRYIAQMNMEDLQTKEGTEKLREELDQFLTDNPPSSESQLARITELAHHLGSKQLKMQAEQVSSRCKEVEDMIIKRQNMIKSAENRLKDTLELPPSDDASSGFSSNPRDDDLSTEAGDDNKDSVDSMGPMFSWKQDAGRGYDENDELIAAFDTAMPSKMKERLKYIVQEIIDTERDYVESLEYVIKHYLPEMDKEYLPPTLAGRKNILFGNMKLNTMQRMLSIIQLSEADLLSVYFSQELENYQHSPLQIGKCFLKWERQFYIYALYNKNKPKSDTILNDYGNAYFRTKQNELGDKLNLASFLIKPVQRLGKYALLLKDMADYISSYRPWIIKLKDMTSCCSLNDPRLAELKAAQEMMKFQLRHGNDLLAMDSVRDCDVNLKEQGCLLRQGDFMVWIGRRKRLRRVFLFEDLVLFTKAKKQAGQGDRFMSKHSLKTADMGVTENIGESGLKFELWYRRMKRGKATESYVLQATNTEIKNSWVADITKILWRQAQRNKDYELTEVTTGISIESQPSGLYSEMPMTVQSPAPAIVRSKSADSAASNQGKRLSWLSAESSNTSGVHDLGSLPEETGVYFRRDQDVNGQNIMDSSTDQAYSTLPRNSFRKPKGIEINPEVKMSYVTEALVDIPQTRVRFRDTGMDGAFIRNTLHRRTLHVDKQLDRNVIEDQHSPRRHSIDKSPQHLSRSYSDTESSASSRNVSINDSIKSPSYSDYAISPDRPTSPLRSVTFDESEEDITDNKPRSQSDIINAEEQTIGKSNSSDIATSSEAFLCQSSPTLADEKAVRRESDGKKDKQRQKASKEKRLSLGALLGRKKKPSTSS